MPRRILVIEDSRVIQQLVAVSLRPLEVAVDARYDGVSGLAAVLEQPPDVLVLDIGLPGMSGWEVLRHIRADVDVRHTKVLVLTAHAQEESRTKADQIGADRFMTKPFQPDMLRRAVAELLGEDRTSETSTLAQPAAGVHSAVNDHHRRPPVPGRPPG